MNSEFVVVIPRIDSFVLSFPTGKKTHSRGTVWFADGKMRERDRGRPYVRRQKGALSEGQGRTNPTAVVNVS